MVSVCHVFLQEHVIQRSCDFMGRSQSKQVTILPSLVVIGTLVVEMFLVLSCDRGRKCDQRVM